ncbi:MAG: Hypothetical protein AJITA_00191 [Acetilactobacillus jinshanensis]
MASFILGGRAFLIKADFIWGAAMAEKDPLNLIWSAPA